MFHRLILTVAFYLIAAAMALTVGVRGALSQTKDMQKRSPKDAPQPGEPAPDFELALLGGEPDDKIKLADFKGKKPVVLVFGSYT